jgi:prepilin-type N-terminal cleavage/methylation domain-containing protein/prepilin-type processing-associated H-X9-DG protein
VKNVHGFTLIEVLTVIAIMAVLAALAIPTISYMQQRAKAVQCANNLRQVGAGLLAYAAENNNRLPGPGSPGDAQSRWLHQTAVYMGYEPNRQFNGKSVYRQAYSLPVFHCALCPKDKYQTANGLGEGHAMLGLNNAFHGTSAQQAAHGDPMTSYLTLAAVVQPSRKVMVAEKSWLSWDGYGSSGPTVDRTGPYPERAAGAAANHRNDFKPQNGPDGNALYLFVDGHVETLTKWPGVEAFDPQAQIPIAP